MQRHAKRRLFAMIFFLFFIGAIAYNWHLLITQGKFYLQASGLAPIGALVALIFFLVPSRALNTHPRDKRSIIIMVLVGIVGMVLGGINFYLMDHYK